VEEERGWDPWDALAENPDVELRFHPAAGAAGGAIYARKNGKPYIVMAPGQHRHERNESCGHEVVHHELDLVWTDDTPDELVDKGEQLVADTVAERMVPLDRMMTFVRWRLAAGEAVTVHDVAVQFDVSDEMAAEAIALAKRRGVA